MWLLQRSGDSGFRLVERADGMIPPYAILSHTWGPARDEVTYLDLINGMGTKKPGYRKINFCAKQAAHDGLHFFWIDTCCIDKRDSTELQEAINSMFRWYRDAAKCYVYLGDVSTDSFAKDDLEFRKSRWFTRGWTLQELLAPSIVEFFSSNGHPLGSKADRVQEIADITHIPVEALQGKSLSDFSVDERMLWTEERTTTKGEDMAYSLMGVFNVHMIPNYGEGKESAFKRLHREIRESQDIGESDPFGSARSWVGGATIDRNMEEYFRHMLLDDKSRSRSPMIEEVVLQSDVFHFAFQEPTMLHETSDQFRLLMDNSNKKGPPDLVAVKRTGTSDQNIEINVLYGATRLRATNYKNLLLRIITPDFTPLRDHVPDLLDFTLTDWNGDGTLDLVAIKRRHTESHSTEVHIFSGSSQFQRMMLQTGTILEETDETWSFGMGRWSGGDKPDLFAIKKSDTGTMSTEVHVLSGDHNFQRYVLQTGTGLHETDDTFDFVVTDWNGDGRPDLVAVKKSKTNRKCTEVHVLSGASTYRDFDMRAETPIFKSNGLYDFAVADWTGNGRPDLIALKKRDTGTNTTEMHVMSVR